MLPQAFLLYGILEEWPEVVYISGAHWNLFPFLETQHVCWPMKAGSLGSWVGGVGLCRFAPIHALLGGYLTPLLFLGAAATASELPFGLPVPRMLPYEAWKSLPRHGWSSKVVLFVEVKKKKRLVYTYREWIVKPGICFFLPIP